jgi:hypothetical protein
VVTLAVIFVPTLNVTVEKAGVRGKVRYQRGRLVAVAGELSASR